MQQWQQLEKELFKKEEAKTEVIENHKKQPLEIQIPEGGLKPNEQVPMKNVKLIRQPSSDEGCYTSSSNTISRYGFIKNYWSHALRGCS